ncbi:MAG TPA: LLM class flavin-dependent oxidoreductase [Acidimicrobiales bacterium]|nr:LLM class flavin-dependent oxidoreductase [Acidimicrobiales bacterium]
MTPLAAGSVGLGLYLHDLPPGPATHRLVAQAVAAEQAGFDGVSVAEHHAGFPGYLPNPVLAATWMLEATRRLWCGPMPLLLPLRSPALVAEDLAWLDARFPGRVAAGFAPGYHADDFAAVGAGGFEERGRLYGERLTQVASTLRGEATGPAGRDRAVVARGGVPVPLVSAAGSPGAARRAARAGVGLLLDSMARADDLARVVAAYEGAGGTGPCILGRRVWVGDPPLHLFEAQLAAYRSKADAASWMQQASADLLIGGAADEVVDRVVEAAKAAHATALALRVHLPGLDPDVADDQIRRVGAQVVPAVRAALSAHVEEP